jgi:uncharacterized membrane protein YfcA
VDAGLLMLAGGVVAGVFGSLLGLGGGVLIVPFLTLVFGLPVRDAVGVSLVCVIVTSGASAAVFLERRVANLRLGMLLELFTATGAVVGGAIAFLLDERFLAGLFAALLVYVAVTMLRRSVEEPGRSAEVRGESSEADGPGPAVTTAVDDLEAGASETSPPVGAMPGAGESFVERLSGPGYRPRRLGPGAVGSVVAGLVSALLGIGGGIVKVPVMNIVMGVPLRVATATSNLMIGITASTSAIVYLLRGGIDPYIAGPTAVGVFLGATLGSRTAHRIDLRLLRLLFAAVLLYTAFEMARRALGIG